MDVSSSKKAWQDAMTSKQAMLLLEILLVLPIMVFASGCGSSPEHVGADPLISPYAQRRVWAIAPFHNESGTSFANGIIMSDHFAQHLTNASNLHVLPVNRTLKAMELLQMAEVGSHADARQLMTELGADALIIGTISAYDPWDPPKLGLAIQLYDSGQGLVTDPINIRHLTRAATSNQTNPVHKVHGQAPIHLPLREQGIASSVSAYFDAADFDVQKQLKKYAGNRSNDGMLGPQDNWHRYRISMDLYSEFVTYVMSWRLLREEARRLSPPPTTNTTTTPQASSR
jgi:hypothetical protein